jgi:hypothetical protein
VRYASTPAMTAMRKLAPRIAAERADSRPLQSRSRPGISAPGFLEGFPWEEGSDTLLIGMITPCGGSREGVTSDGSLLLTGSRCHFLATACVWLAGTTLALEICGTRAFCEKSGIPVIVGK